MNCPRCCREDKIPGVPVAVMTPEGMKYFDEMTPQEAMDIILKIAREDKPRPPIFEKEGTC